MNNVHNGKSEDISLISEITATLTLSGTGSCYIVDHSQRHGHPQGGGGVGARLPPEKLIKRNSMWGAFFMEGSSFSLCGGLFSPYGDIFGLTPFTKKFAGAHAQRSRVRYVCTFMGLDVCVAGLLYCLIL